MQHTETVQVADPAKAWAAMADVERWPTWTASVTSAEALDDGPMRLGSRYRLRQPKLPPVVWTVCELTPGRSFSWESRSPGAHAVGEHVVDGTTVRLTIRQEGPVGALVGLLYRGLTRRYVAMEAEGLVRVSQRRRPARP